VSGTPSSYSFDLTSHVLGFGYSTRGPSGKRFAAGSCTAVVVPPLQFPHGYVVEVRGARVTSAPDAGVLALAQISNAEHTVHVEIMPADSGPTGVPHPAALADCS
jgi:hypothetical protein